MADNYSSDKPQSNETLFRKLAKQFRLDRQFSATWRTMAKEEFGFVAGEQWSEEDKEHLKATMRPVITMNRTQTVINAVAGQEMGNRQEVRFLPREQGDVKANEMLTEGARWFRDVASGDDEDSEAFLHTLECGMGWTDTTLDFDGSEDGEPDMAAVNPLEMFWDRAARKNNLTDAERIWRAKKFPRSAAKRLFPNADSSDLDAGWANIDGADESELKDQDRERLYEADGEDSDADDDEQVTIVHCQYITRETAWDVISPLTGEKSEMSDKDYKTYSKRAEQLGMPVKGAKKEKKVIQDCWLGAVVLEKGPALCQDKFRYQCITGYRDENKGTFYGLVRSMKDPQRWANKWLSQTLDLMNSQSKGGVMMEEDAVEDIRKFEKNWARADKPTIVSSGALSGANGPKIVPKPAGQFPQGFYQLMEFSFSMIQQVPGISPELMGQADRDQPASLEYQRKQAGMTILQPLFKNLKRYRKENGHVILYILQNHMAKDPMDADRRLIRVLGDDSEQYIPLIKQADVKYDIIVDDSPTSPNQKEMVWAMIGERFWDLPPPIQLAFLDYSPFPSDVVKSVRKAADEAQQAPMAQLQQKMAEMTAMLEQAKVGQTKADEQLKLAQAQKTASEVGQDNPQHEMQIKQAELGVKQAESQGKLQLQAQETQAKIQLKQQELAGNMAMKQQEQTANLHLQAQSAAQESSIRAREADSNMALQSKTADANIALKTKMARSAARQKAAGAR